MADVASGDRIWTVAARDKNFIEQESADLYKRIRMERLNNDISTWSLELPNTSPAIDVLTQSGAGIVVRRADTDKVEMSGYVLDVYLAESENSPGGDVTAVGVCDNILMSKEQLYVNPAQDVSTSALTKFAQQWDLRSGPAETVMKDFLTANLGPAAGIVRRRYPWLNIPATTGLGTVGSWKGRFDFILDMFQKIGKYGNVNFRLQQSAPGEITFYVTEPTVNPEVRFSIEAYNLQSVTATLRNPNGTEVIVAGGGEGKDRVYTRRVAAGLEAEMGFRQARYLNQSHTLDLAELRQAADIQLAEDVATSGFQTTIIDTPALSYGKQFELGDIGSIVVRGVEYTDIIQRVLIEHEAGTAPTFQPTIGKIGDGENFGNTSIVRRIIRSLNQSSRS